MTKAYVVEVKFTNGTKYLAAGGKLSKIPKFFTSWASIKQTIGRSGYGYGDLYYGVAHRAMSTIYVITELEGSLETSRAEKLSYEDFMSRDFSATAAKSNPNSVFKLQRADGTFVSGKYSSSSRHGKTWNRAGDLRAHLSQRVRTGWANPFVQGQHLYDAKVVEIEYPEDKTDLIPVRIIKHDVQAFYLQSPACRKHYDKLVRKLK